MEHFEVVVAKLADLHAREPSLTPGDLVTDFLANDPVPTFAPIRRAAASTS